MARGVSKLLARFRGSKLREEAVCYAYEESLFICAISEVRNGPGVEWEPYYRLSSADSDDAIGKVLSQVLDGSGLILNLRDPTELQKARKEQLRVAGFSSEQNLMKRAVFCLVERLPKSIRFTPTHNGGTCGDTKGFHHLTEIATTIPLPAKDSEIGAALRVAVRSCTRTIDAPAA